MPIGIAAHTMATPGMTVEGAVELYRRLGFDAFDLVYQSGYGCGLSDETPEREVARLAGVVGDAGLVVSCLIPYVKAYNSLDERARKDALDAAKRSVDVAAALAAPAIRILAGEEVESDAAGRAWGAMVETLGRLADFAETRGIDLLLENHMENQVTSAAQMVALVQALDHPRVGIIHDPANLTIMGEPDDRSAFDLQQPHIRHVHLNDIHLVEEHPGYAAALFDAGQAPWRRWVSWLVEAGYEGHMTIEYVYRWEPDALPAPEDGLPGELAAIRGAVRAAGGRLAR